MNIRKNSGGARSGGRGERRVLSRLATLWIRVVQPVRLRQVRFGRREGGEVRGEVRGVAEGGIRSEGLARADPAPLDLERVAQASAVRFLDGVRDVTLFTREAVVTGSGGQPRWLGRLDRTALSLTELVQRRPPLGVIVSALAPLPLACNAVADYLRRESDAIGQTGLSGAACCVYGLDVHFCGDGTPRLTVLRPPDCVHRKLIGDHGTDVRFRQSEGAPSGGTSAPSRARSHTRGGPRGHARTGILKESTLEPFDSRAPPLHALFAELLTASAMASASPQLQSVADWWRDTCALICVPEDRPPRGGTGEFGIDEPKVRRGTERARAVHTLTTRHSSNRSVVRAVQRRREPPSQRARWESGGVQGHGHARNHRALRDSGSTRYSRHTQDSGLRGDSGLASENWPGEVWAAECEARILACAEALPIDPDAYR